MAISRSLGLMIKLSGEYRVKTKLFELQNDALNLQKTLSNLTIKTSDTVDGSNIVSNLNAQFIQPLENVVSNVKKQGSKLKLELQNISKLKLEFRNISNKSYGIESISGVSKKSHGIGPISGISNYADNISKIKTIKPIPNTTPSFSELNQRINASSNAGKFQPQDAPDYVQTNLRGLGNYAAYEASVKQAIQEAKIVALKKQQLQLGNEMAARCKKMQQEELDRINNTAKVQKQRLDEVQNKAQQLIQTGFGLHIAQIYVAPIVYALEQVTAKMVEAFSEFDKKYTSYMVKSEEFGEYLSKGDFYEASVGQVYGLQDNAIAAERFAASGVDVAKSQAALTSVMQVATVADMDYAEAANGVIKTMQAMHMEVQDTTEITDALINSANASTAELSDLVQWFEYSASAAYQMKVGVKDLSAYLGILASSGTPNTGAATRQLFLQLSKEDIQKNLKGKFSWITDDDLTDFNSLITKMRDYVKSQDDQSAATLEITRLLGGKANAQQALNNLLMAEPELWSQVTNAVKETGSTQDLYNKITDNSADAIARIKVNLNILLTQLGESFGPFLKIISSGLTVFTSTIVALPKWFKTLLGFAILVVTALTTLVFVVLGLVGGISILTGMLTKLSINEKLVAASTRGWAATLGQLLSELYTVTIAGTSYGNMLKGISISTVSAATATKVLSDKQLVLNSVAWGLSGALVGYMASSSLMQKSMYSEAYLVGHLTAMWLAYSAARAASVAGPLAAMGAAVAVGAAYEAIMYNQIETMKTEAFDASIRKQTGAGTTINKNIKVNIANANLTTDGIDYDDLISATDSDFDE